MTDTEEDAPREIADEIASRILSIRSLEERKQDALDFHDCHVSSIREALEAAYRAGQESV